MQVHVGMSGFAYKEWKGSFYPEDLAADDMLEFYSTRFTTVEMNNTFYRMPSEKTLLQWAGSVPEGFTFALKASRRITHHARLGNVGDLLDYVVRNAAILGPKLGPLLFQLPPTMKKDLDRLRVFLTLLPPTWKIALEWRHPSWEDEEVYGLLGSHGVAAVTAEFDDPVALLRSSTGWGYLRLHRAGYTPDDLRRWVDRIGDQQWQECFVYFKHEEDIAGPERAQVFAGLLR
jgi:uncharacterized protein YecE (DUF72 family)